MMDSIVVSVADEEEDDLGLGVVDICDLVSKRMGRTHNFIY